MNLDNFREEVAVKHNQTVNMILYVLAWIAMIALAITAISHVYAMLSGHLDIATILTVLISGGLTALLFFKKDELRVEYDYTFTNGELDVARILSNSRRRLMTTVKMKDIEAAGPVNDKGFVRFMNNKDVKKHNWFVNRTAPLYYFYFVKNEVRHAIVLELSPDMVKMIKPYLPFGAWSESKVG